MKKCTFRPFFLEKAVFSENKSFFGKIAFLKKKAFFWEKKGIFWKKPYNGFFYIHPFFWIKYLESRYLKKALQWLLSYTSILLDKKYLELRYLKIRHFFVLKTFLLEGLTYEKALQWLLLQISILLDKIP